MVGLPEEKLLYTEIQMKLYYIIPEKWESRYLYLKEDIEIFKRSDKKIIETYMDSTEYRKGLNKPYYVENIYKLPVKNIIDYEKTLTVDEAIEQSKDNVPKEKKKFGLFKKKNRMQDVIFDDEENNNDNPKNQILNYKK